MKKTALTKVLAIMAVVAFMVAMIPFALSNNRQKSAMATEESITNVTKAYFPSPEARNYYNMSYGRDNEYGDYFKISAFQTCDTLMWLAFDVKWQAGVTYDITYSVKTGSTATATLADAYVLLNGKTVNEALPYGFYRIDKATPEWSTISFVYTPSADGTTGSNFFALNIKLGEGDEFYISNVQVIENSAKENLFGSGKTSFQGFEKGEGTAYYQAGDANKETVFNHVSDGNKDTLTFVKDVPSVNSFYTNVNWETGYDYRLSFNFKVTKGDASSNFRIMPIAYLNGASNELSGMMLEPASSSKNFSFVFTPGAAAGSGSNAFSMNIWNGIKAGDVFEFTNLRIDKIGHNAAEAVSDCINLYDLDKAFWGSDADIESIEFGIDDTVQAPVDGAEVFYAVRSGEGTGVYERWNKINFIKGATYYVSYWVMTNEISSGLFFQPAIYDSENHQIVMGELQRDLMVSSTSITPNTWKKCMFTYTHEGENFEGSLKFIYGNAMAQGDTVYLADIKVTPKTHVFTAEIESPEYLKTPATATEDAVYYKSCVYCGKSSESTDGEAVFTVETKTVRTVGASVRVSGEASIRFISEISKAKLNELTQGCQSYEIGTVLKGGVLTNDTLTVDTANAVNIVNGGGYWQETDDKLVISAYLEEIDGAHYASKISARAYIKVVKDGTASYVYADVITRSLQEVAAAALADVSDTMTGDYVYDLGDGTFSRYDQTAIAKLKQYAD